MVWIDLADQINSYSQQSRKTVKWYKKAAFDLILGVSITNIFLIDKILMGMEVQLVSLGNVLLVKFWIIIIRDRINMLFFANFWHISAYFSVFQN